MFWKKLFYASASILMLAIAYHLGARSATAQTDRGIIGYSTEPLGQYVITVSGDVWFRGISGNCCPPAFGGAAPDFVGNFWSGAGPTPAKPETWGSVKSRYR